MRRHLLVLAALALVLPAPVSAADWLRVESPNFVIFSEVSERRTRDYATEFERFREALGRIVPGAAARSTVPVLVFIFNDQRSMGSYRPLYNGKPVQVSGYAWRDGNIGVMMLAASDREAALRTILHEYTHLLIANVARGFPVWLNEGFAEYYSTFTVDPDGRTALLGGVLVHHLQRLNQERLLTLEELLSVRHDSPLYNEGARRSVFYSQSWALVHMLLNGKPDRADAVRKYLQLVGAGKPSLEAWREVFGDAKIIDDLQRYVGRQIMTGYRYRFSESVAPTALAMSKPEPDDVQAALGDLRRMVTPERAAEHVETLAQSKRAHAAAIRGLSSLDRGDYAQALPLLLDAAQRADDWLVHYRAAVGLERIVQSSSGANREAAAAGLQALDRVHAARPDLPHAYGLRARLLGPVDDGLKAIRRARELSPGHEQYALWEATIRINRGEFVQARQVLGPLLSPAFPPELREHARMLMGQAVTRERGRAAAAAARADAAAEAAAGGRGPRPPGGVIHVFRDLKPGEERVEGLFERLECPRSGPVFYVRVGDTVRRFAGKLESVEFITYRDDLTGSVGCGPRTPPDRVNVTFKPAAAGDAVVIAIEFLPLKNGALP